METDWSSRRDRDSITSTSCSAATASGSTPSRRSRRSSLKDQLRALTEEIIELKFKIAEQMGKKDEIQHDWQKLNTEKSSIQEEIANIDTENNGIRADTDQTREELEKARLRLDRLAKERSPEQKVEDDARREYTSVQAELKATKEEMDIVEAAGRTLLTDIENLKGNASRISSEGAKLETESNEVELEIFSLRGEIATVQQSIQETKSTTAEYDADLRFIRKECEKIAKQNEVLESKIAIRDEITRK
jgi:chromosome segregation ATPase